MNRSTEKYRGSLEKIARECFWFTRALNAVQALGLRSWCIGAGAVRNLVWDHLHGCTEPSDLADIDVAYFDATDLSQATDAAYQRSLSCREPDLPWEVTNQAVVHLWFEKYFGHAVPALKSIEEAVASWPEYATSVGVYLDSESKFEIIAPYGLDDLFEMRVRRNPSRVSAHTYRLRIEQKKYHQRWPKVTIIP